MTAGNTPAWRVLELSTSVVEERLLSVLLDRAGTAPGRSRSTLFSDKLEFLFLQMLLVGNSVM